MSTIAGGGVFLITKTKASLLALLAAIVVIVRDSIGLQHDHMHTRAIAKNRVIAWTIMLTLMVTNTTKRGDQAPLMRNCGLVL